MEKNRIITVTETVTEKCAANNVRIDITVRGEAKKYAAAVSDADEKSDKLVGMFSDLGLNLSGGGISVGVPDGKQTLYRATRNFGVQFALDGGLLEKALDALGENAVQWTVSFVYDDADKKKELLSAAVKAARAHAEIIASAAGAKLGALYGVEYASGAGRPMLMRMSMGGGAEPEEISVSETVTCSWSVD